MRKGLWSPDEDEKLRNSIAHHRSGSWSDIARKAGLQRCGKSCRRRWMNHLRPDLKREKFTSEEIRVVARLHDAMGNKWSEIATHLVGRTDNDVKNLWNTQIKRQLRANQKQTNSDDQLVITNNVKSGPSFPFSVECIGELPSEKPDILLHSSYPTLSTATSLDADSRISSSSVDEQGFNTHISAEGLFIDEDQFSKVDLDRLNPLLTSPCQEDNYVCFNNQASSNDQESTLQEAVLMEESFGCLMDGTHLMHTMDALALARPTLTLPNGSINMHYSYSSCDVASNHVMMMMMMENNARKHQQINNAASSHSTWDGSIISDESSTGTTTTTMDDTYSVGQRALRQLHPPLMFHQNDADHQYHHEQEDGADANQPSRREFWSFATCDEWLVESLYGTNEGYSKLTIW